MKDQLEKLEGLKDINKHIMSQVPKGIVTPYVRTQLIKKRAQFMRRTAITVA